MASITLVQRFDLARSIPPAWVEYFDLGTLQVDAVVLEADNELEKTLKDDPLLAQQLRDAATAKIEAAARIINDAIGSQVKRIEEVLKSGEPFQAILRKLEDVKATLNGAIRQATDSLPRAAEQEAQKALDDYARRKKQSRPYRAKVAVKASISLLTIAGGVTSLVLTAGANVIAYVAIANAVAKLGLQLRDGLHSVEQSAAALERIVNELSRDIDSQLSRTGSQAAKEAAAALAPILTAKMSTINTASGHAAELASKLSACERTCTELTAQAMKGVEKLAQIEKAVADKPKKKDQVQKLAARNEEALNKVEELQPMLARQWKFQESCAKQIAEWKAKRSGKVALASRSANLGSFGTAVYGAVSTGAQLAAAV